MESSTPSRDTAWAMSEENFEILRRGFDAFNRSGEPDFSLLDPDVVFDTTGAAFDRAIYRGHDGVRQWLANQREVWASQRFEEEELIAVGEDRVLASFRFVSVGRDGIETVAHFANITTLCDGRVTHMRVFQSEAEALEAAGLSEQAMSQEMVEITLRQVEAVNRGDADAFVATVSSDVEWEDAAFWSEVSRTYRGRAEVREWFNQVVLEPWESLHCEVEEITDAADDRLFFGGLLTARGKGSGVDTELRFWTVNWIADGEVTRRTVFLDRAKALEAAGLRE